MRRPRTSPGMRVCMCTCIHACVSVHVCACVHVYMHVSLHVCTCIHARISVHVCACLHVRVCMPVCACLCIHVCACLHVHVCMPVCTRVCMPVYTRVCMPVALTGRRSRRGEERTGHTNQTSRGSTGPVSSLSRPRHSLPRCRRFSGRTGICPHNLLTPAAQGHTPQVGADALVVKLS